MAAVQPSLGTNLIPPGASSAGVPAVQPSKLEGEICKLLGLDLPAVLNQIKFDSERVVIRAMQLSGQSRAEIQAAIDSILSFVKSADHCPEAFYMLVIRNFPLEMLFDPQCKLYVHRFVQSQKLFRNMALVLQDFNRLHPDGGNLREYCETQQLFVQCGLNAIDKDCFYESLQTANQSLKKDLDKKGDVDLKQCFSRKIYNLGNSLMAIRLPQIIQRVSQLGEINHEEIQKNGRAFFAESIRVHYQHLSSLSLPPSGEFVSQVETLCSQTAPFLERCLAAVKTGVIDVTKEPPRLLREFTLKTMLQASPVACTLLQAILRYNGFQVEIFKREDINPKVCDSFAHVILVVTDPHTQSRVLVDPTYKQFLGGIYSPGELDKLGPEILVSPLDLLEARIAAFAGAAKKRKGKQSDPLLILPKENIEAHFKDLWDLERYEPVTKNEVADWLFASKDHPQDLNYMNLLKMLELVGLEIPYQSFQEKGRLLASRLPQLDRLALLNELQHLPDPYVKFRFDLLGLDWRPVDGHLISPKAVGYAMALREHVNPSHQPKVALYGCSGPDLSMAMLAFDSDLILLDHTPLNPNILRALISATPFPGVPTQQEMLGIMVDYSKMKMASGGAIAKPSAAKQLMIENIEPKFLAEFNALGIDITTVQVDEAPEFNGVTFQFKWNYAGQPVRPYKITYVCAKLDDPNSYPPGLKNLLDQQQIDYFYQKAAHKLPADYAKYLPQIAKGIKPGGYLLTSDTDQHSVTHSPTDLLNTSGVKVAEEDSLLLKAWRNLFKGRLGQGWHTDSVLKANREDRYVPPKEDYWLFTAIRKKV